MCVGVAMPLVQTELDVMRCIPTWWLTRGIFAAHKISTPKVAGFDSRMFHFQVTALGKLFTHVCLCHQAGAVMLCSWEGNRRSGVTLAMHHRCKWFIRLWAHGLDREMSTPPMLSCGVWPVYLTKYRGRSRKQCWWLCVKQFLVWLCWNGHVWKFRDVRPEKFGDDLQIKASVV